MLRYYPTFAETPNPGVALFPASPGLIAPTRRAKVLSPRAYTPTGLKPNPATGRKLHKILTDNNIRNAGSGVIVRL